MQEIKDGLRTRPDQATIRSAIGALPAWRDELRVVLVAPLEQQLEETVTKVVQSLIDQIGSDDGCDETSHATVQQWVELLDHAHMMLRRPGKSSQSSVYKSLAEKLTASSGKCQQTALKKKVEGLCKACAEDSQQTLAASVPRSKS